MINEPQPSHANDMPTADTAPAPDGATGQTASTPADSPAADMSERFERGTDMRALYARMRPDQRTAIAGEFIRLLGLAGDDQTGRFRHRFQRHTQITDEAAEELLSADEVAAIDSYTRQNHPELIAQILQHPVTQSSLESPGVRPGDEEEVPDNKDKIMPTENVATSGAAYGTAWMMMELGGEESDRLVEDPHERQVGPENEIDRERVQRALENEGEEGATADLDPPEDDEGS